MRDSTAMKIYISADMEGIAGAVSDAQLSPDAFDWNAACDIFTAEVVAVIEELRAAGVDAITVSDSHGTGQNLRIEQLPSGVRLVRSWPRPLGMMEGIDDSFAGAIMLGYHAGAHSRVGVRAHTMSSACLFEVALNGRPVCEAELNAAIAGHFGVPVLMLSGDDAIAREVEESLPDTEKVVLKRAISFHSAESVVPSDAIEMLRSGVRQSLARRAEIVPRPVDAPVTLDLTWKNHRPAELLAYLPVVEALDAHRVRFVAKDVLEASRFLEFALNYDPTLQP